MGLQRIFKSSLIIQRENPRHHLVPAIFVGSSAAPRFMFALWHCVSGSHVSKDADHRLPKGDWRAEAFKRTGLTKVIHSCISEAASSAAALSRVPVVLGDTNIKNHREMELAIEEANVGKGGSWIGTQDTFIWSQCSVKAISNFTDFTFQFTFEPAHRGKFHVAFPDPPRGRSETCNCRKIARSSGARAAPASSWQAAPEPGVRLHGAACSTAATPPPRPTGAGRAVKIRGPGTTLFDHGFGFLASRCTFFPF